MKNGTKVYWDQQASETPLAYVVTENLGDGEYAIEEPNGTEWIARASELEVADDEHVENYALPGS